MSFMSNLALIQEMLESSESSIRSAKQLLNEIMGGQGSKSNYAKMAEKLPDMEGESDSSASSKSKIVEGIFDGQNMVGKDKNIYPVPANYASKSKLIPGDVLKLTISEEGGFVYKQICPAARKNILGTLTMEDGKYKVIAGGKVYNVLLASVTYYKGEPGDQVSLIVPESGESEWGAIEGIIPQMKVETDMMRDTENQATALGTEEAPVKEKKTRKSKKTTTDEDEFGNLDV